MIVIMMKVDIDDSYREGFGYRFDDFSYAFMAVGYMDRVFLDVRRHEIAF